MQNAPAHTPEVRGGQTSGSNIAHDPQDVKTSTQIKSATDTIGTFDGSNPGIRYSKRSSIRRKSVNEFTSEEIQKTEKWARKFYRELGDEIAVFPCVVR